MAITTGLYIMVARTIIGRTERFTKKIIQSDRHFDIIIEYSDIPKDQWYELVNYFGEDKDTIKMNFQAKFVAIKGKYVTSSIRYPIETTRRRIKKNIEKAFKPLTRHEISGILDRVDAHPAVIFGV